MPDSCSGELVGKTSDRAKHATRLQIDGGGRATSGPLELNSAKLNLNMQCLYCECELGPQKQSLAMWACQKPLSSAVWATPLLAGQ